MRLPDIATQKKMKNIFIKYGMEKMNEIEKPTLPEIITPEYIESYLKYIESEINDDEVAHIEEDDLYSTILHAIANDKCSDIKRCCELALKSKDLDFCRWYS